MSKIPTHLVPSLALCALGLAAGEASAAITVDSFSMTATSFSFTISGALPASLPAREVNTLFLVNTDPSDGNVFSFGDHLITISAGFTGTHDMYRASAGNALYGDFVALLFRPALLGSTTLDGTINATWAVSHLNPDALIDTANLKLFWGTGTHNVPASGIYLATFPTSVPEPSTYGLIGAGAAAVLVLAARRRKA